MWNLFIALSAPEETRFSIRKRVFSLLSKDVRNSISITKQKKSHGRETRRATHWTYNTIPVEPGTLSHVINQAFGHRHRRHCWVPISLYNRVSFICKYLQFALTRNRMKRERGWKKNLYLKINYYLCFALHLCILVISFFAPQLFLLSQFCISHWRGFLFSTC
jgi:hypothetical protein